MQYFSINTILRILIAAVIIVITAMLIGINSEITKEWEAVFLIVIGYYFNERPREDEYIEFGIKSNDTYLLSYLKAEIFGQFFVALLLISFTIVSFIITDAESISGAWVGSVILAVGFYFKDSKSIEVRNMHEIFRASIAAIVTFSSLAFIYSDWYEPKTIPTQWVGIVLIVVAFYFKDRAKELINR